MTIVRRNTQTGSESNEMVAVTEATSDLSVKREASS